MAESVQSGGGMTRDEEEEGVGLLAVHARLIREFCVVGS